MNECMKCYTPYKSSLLPIHGVTVSIITQCENIFSILKYI